MHIFWQTIYNIYFLGQSYFPPSITKEHDIRIEGKELLIKSVVSPNFCTFLCSAGAGVPGTPFPRGRLPPCSAPSSRCPQLRRQRGTRCHRRGRRRGWGGTEGQAGCFSKKFCNSVRRGKVLPGKKIESASVIKRAHIKTLWRSFFIYLFIYLNENIFLIAEKRFFPSFSHLPVFELIGVHSHWSEPTSYSIASSALASRKANSLDPSSEARRPNWHRRPAARRGGRGCQEVSVLLGKSKEL